VHSEEGTGRAGQGSGEMQQECKELLNKGCKSEPFKLPYTWNCCKHLVDCCSLPAQGDSRTYHHHTRTLQKGNRKATERQQKGSSCGKLIRCSMPPPQRPNMATTCLCHFLLLHFLPLCIQQKECRALPTLLMHPAQEMQYPAQ
jgi:hypothetical protein